MRVYLSSTFRDLVEERKAALDAIRRLGHQPVSMEDYGAASGPPVQKCVRDVEGCDLYVGVLGWCYGSLVPGDAEGRSFTHVEYDTAIAKGIPRLLYLSPEPEGWRDHLQDPAGSGIGALRDLVRSREMAATFRNADDLRYQVGTDLNRELGRGRGPHGVPRLLPYTCDRTRQLEELHFNLSGLEDDRRGWPLLCLVHGAERQGAVPFVECLEQKFMAEILGRPRDEVSVRSFPLLWPKEADPARFRRSLEFQLSKEICGRPGLPLHEVAAELSGPRMPVLLWTHLPSGPWSPGTRDGLVEFARFWLAWPKPLYAHPILVLALIERPPPSAGLAGLWQRWRAGTDPFADALAGMRALDPEARRILILPPLENVTFEDVVLWLQRREVEDVFGEVDLVPRVRALFDDARGMPMEILATRLNQVLEAAVDGGAP